MTKQEIIKELRRSACEDRWPAKACRLEAFNAAREWSNSRWDGWRLLGRPHVFTRTFFLFVACALEG
jgi:hypothetical protein